MDSGKKKQPSRSSSPKPSPKSPPKKVVEKKPVVPIDLGSDTDEIEDLLLPTPTKKQSPSPESSSESDVELLDPPSLKKAPAASKKRSRSPSPTRANKKVSSPAFGLDAVATVSATGLKVGDIVFVRKTANDNHQATIVSNPNEDGEVEVKWELRGGTELVDVDICKILSLSPSRPKRSRRATAKK